MICDSQPGNNWICDALLGCRESATSPQDVQTTPWSHSKSNQPMMWQISLSSLKLYRDGNIVKVKSCIYNDLFEI